MKVYQIRVTETRERLVEVEAETDADALREVENAYGEGNLVLDTDYIQDVHIEKRRTDE